MSDAPRPPDGALVGWWEGSELRLAAVAGAEKNRLLVVDPAGREHRVKASKLEFALGTGAALPPPGPARRAHLADRARVAAARVEEEAAEIDVPVLWELVTEESGPAARVEPEALAALSLGRADESAQAALLAALSADGIRFARRTAGWSARPAEAVEGMLRQRERERVRSEERARLLAALRAVGRGAGFEPAGDATEAETLRALEQVAIFEDGVSEAARRLAAEALAAWGGEYAREAEGAFRLLRAIGRFDSDDANLAIPRHGLRVEFPPEVREEAARLAAGDVAGADRVDRTAARCVTIDDARTRELDDALSAEPRPGGGWRLAIHIADPAALVPDGSAVDREALERGTTHYFPDGKLLMLPAVLSEHAASLNPGERRPAVSFLAELDARGSVETFAIERSWIAVSERLTYDEVDARIAAGDAALGALHACARARLDLRLARGAVHLSGPEAELAVEGGEPRFRIRDRDAPSQVAVAESMILAGDLAARRLVEAGVEAIYRWQAEPLDLPDAPSSDAPPDASADAAPDVTDAESGVAGGPGGPAGSGGHDPVGAHETRRRLRRAETSLRPRRHASLALDAYVQVTSPLRRYQDLAMQRQLLAAVERGSARYDREALQAIAATTDLAERRARRAEREARDYWTLRWLAARTGEELEATVLAVEPRVRVLLDGCLWQRDVPGLTGATPGERVRLRVARVLPRAGLLHLQPLGIA